VWVLLASVAFEAQQSWPSEYQVKAAYLYNFSKFVEWPASTSAAAGDLFTICVIGRDPFGPILDTTVSGTTIAGKAVVPKRISNIQEVAGCRILFISLSEESHLRDILGATSKTGVLTVSEIADFSQRGGMIEFVLQENKVRFEVDPRSAEEAGLALSSELLKVAISVRKNQRRVD
jgi:hypothetical protein